MLLSPRVINGISDSFLDQLLFHSNLQRFEKRSSPRGFKPATPDLRAYALTTTPQVYFYVIIPNLNQHFKFFLENF